ncbi:Uncharacterised protein [Salmonella enterica subsp. enterica serovar Typhi]|nr:Uncharacterised protein [Salmonella enterica subsp. enterica serovar Typhi]CHL20685.1 Uncharacterised protein [Salmonella enterica subsp. enterica serovar Typhi]CHL25405.1 Uncharacterised protein [Salmonella enterica subsp. enterica serovar Typhi]CHL26546.1 Uncharacterised protein [Salmonella enterica subsp. enterica serovar Typhi]CHM78824.1 Uncharacterised protein [Salmonella enterica subsp. enterica serovar Typhi]
MQIDSRHKRIDGGVLARGSLPEIADLLRRFISVAVNDLFEEVFVDEVYHFTSVVEAISAFQALFELLIALFEVTEDIVVEPGTPASVGAGEEVPMFFFLLIFRVASCHKVFDLLVSQFHLLFLSV